jgi:lipoate-protein ligase B
VASTPDSSAPAARGLLRADFRSAVDFASCLEEQLAQRDALVKRLQASVDGGEERAPGGRLFMVEHEPTLTLGRRATEADVLWDAAELRAKGLTVCETPRGGEATLHAPGQLVAYPIVRVGRQIRAHIVTMAEVTVELARSFGVSGAEFRMDHPGVWIGDAKLASIGIHVSRGVTVQGLSLNIDVAPDLFGALVSCGLPTVEMVSLTQLADRPLPSMAVLARLWAEGFASRAGYSLAWSGPTA